MGSISDAILSEPGSLPQPSLPGAAHEARVLKLQLSSLGKLLPLLDRMEVVVGIQKHNCCVLECIQSTTSLVLQGQRMVDNRMELARAVPDGLGRNQARLLTLNFCGLSWRYYLKLTDEHPQTLSHSWNLRTSRCT